jgi:hypothetical protein
MNEADKPKTILRFGDCTLANLEDTFGLKQGRTLPVLEQWLADKAEVSDLEKQILAIFQEGLIANVHDWNEQELSLHFIGPLFSLVKFTTQQFNLFAERYFSAIVEGIEVRGEPDGMIASGFREPKKPYFCFQEYKKFKDPNGDPAGQCLAAMLVAQELNETKYPVYGCFVMGHDWYFMVLQGREYAISQAYVATRDDIFDIFRILKGLKQIITELVEQNC